MPPPPLDCLGCKSQTQLEILQLQYLEAIYNNGSGGGGGGGPSNLTGINGVAPSVGCGTSDAGTLRVAHATNCVVPIDGPVTVDNAAGAAAVNIQDGGNSITVDGTVAVSTLGTITPGTAASSLGKAEDAAHASGDVGVMALSVANVAQSAFAADGDYIPRSADLAGNTMVVGNIANDGVDAGAPVKVGAVARTASHTGVVDGDRVNLTADKFGQLVTVHAIREVRINQVTTITASTAETTILTAVASNFLDLYGLIVTNTSATAVNVAIKDSTAGTTRLNIAVPANETRGYMLPACDGHKQATANNNWTATVSASVTSVIITCLAKQTT